MVTTTLPGILAQCLPIGLGANVEYQADMPGNTVAARF